MSSKRRTGLENSNPSKNSLEPDADDGMSLTWLPVMNKYLNTFSKELPRSSLA